VIATKYEYRHRFVIIALVFVFAYAFYNLDPLNVVYAIVPRNLGVPIQNVLARFIYGASALVAAFGTAMLTWSSAYRVSIPARDPPKTSCLQMGGPYRHVRNPHYIGSFMLVMALGSFQSRLGFPVLIAGETLLFLRLIAREEMQLEHEYQDTFRTYREHVPRLLPSLRPRVAADTQPPQWRRAFGEHAFHFGLVATLVAFACTLSDPVGYRFASATLLLLAVQRLVQPLWSRFRHS
jgi:protein-S-isoprenylcysteine O-methyltransferase Ste14